MNNITLTLIWTTTITITIATTQCERSKTEYYYTMRQQLQYYNCNCTTAMRASRNAQGLLKTQSVLVLVYDVVRILLRKTEHETLSIISFIVVLEPRRVLPERARHTKIRILWIWDLECFPLSYNTEEHFINININRIYSIDTMQIIINQIIKFHFLKENSKACSIIKTNCMDFPPSTSDLQTYQCKLYAPLPSWILVSFLFFTRSSLEKEKKIKNLAKDDPVHSSLITNFVYWQVSCFAHGDDVLLFFSFLPVVSSCCAAATNFFGLASLWPPFQIMVNK